MKRYLFILLIFSLLSQLNLISQPQIGFYPPQVHQQICQESTYTRYLNVFNYGKETLSFNAAFTPGPFEWVSASPLIGEIQPGDTILVIFNFNSTGLALDNYYAYLQFNSNDPDNPDTSVLAMLHVQQLTIFIEPDSDSICLGCTTKLNTMAFGCSEEYQFDWTSDPPGFTSNEKNPIVAPQVNTTYTVNVTDGGGSALKSVYIQVYGSSDIAENQYSSEISIFPNPFQNQFSLKFNTETDEMAEINISDLSGRIIYTGYLRLIKGINEYAVNPGRLIAGIYLLSVNKQNVTINSFPVKTKVIVYQ